jgi:pilus assembly protein CpaE
MPEKILVVDDDIDSLKLIGLMLQRNGYEVSAANAGGQAIAKAAAEHPDLIILDVMMPDMNGYEVCRRLRSNTETQGIPIIMFTAKTLIDDKVAGFEAGADDYLTKPTHPAELASRVRAILSRSTNQKQQRESNAGSTIGVIGAKGGVGATTLALNIGAATLLNNENPIVVDFRLGSGSMGLMLGVGNAQGMANLLTRPAGEINPTVIEEELTIHQTGLRTILSSVRSREAQINYPVETALTLVRQLRSMSRLTVFDLGATLTANMSRLQREMDLLILAVEPLNVTLTMARELLPELEAGRNTPGRVHVVVVNRTQSGMQTPWNEVEQVLGQEIRAIISSAPDLTFQAMQANMPMVVFQSSAIVSSQIAKLAEDLNARAEAMLSGEVNM